MKKHLIHGLVAFALLFGTLLSLPVHPVYAFVGNNLYVATTGSNTSNCQNVASPCATIAYAITQTISGDRIFLAAGTYNEHNLAITFDLEIDGAAMGTTIINGGATDRVFSISGSSNVYLQTMTIENGLTSGDGGGIDNNSSGSVYLSQVRVTGNHASAGGGIYSSGPLSLTDVEVDNNLSNLSGGGLFLNQAGADVFDRVTISTNQSLGGANYGGGIHQQGGGNLSLTNVSIYNNTAHAGGGVVNTGASTIHVLNSSISGNHATAVGGFENYATADFKNTLLSGNADADCDNSGTMTDNGYNLLSDASCSAALTDTHDLHSTPVSVNLTSPTWSGFIPVVAPVAGSATIDAGSATGCPADDARMVSRPVDGNLFGGAVCDIGAFEFRPDSAITVTSVSPRPSGMDVPTTVNVRVTGTGPVPTGDVSVQLSETSCIATLSPTGTGSCVLTPTIPGVREVDVFHKGDAQYEGSANFTSLIVTEAAKLMPVRAQDGWVLETTETSSLGGSLNSTAGTIRLGDDAARRQYRSILSFNTGAALPDTAVITNVILQVKRQSVSGGGNPVTTFQGFMLDVRKGAFGMPLLQASDFQVAANHTYGPFRPVVDSIGWYSIYLPSAKAYINKLSTGSGLTQIRLRFKVDDNNNAIANILSLYSGNATLLNRPVLTILYYVP